MKHGDLSTLSGVSGQGDRLAQVLCTAAVSEKAARHSAVTDRACRSWQPKTLGEVQSLLGVFDPGVCPALKRLVDGEIG